MLLMVNVDDVSGETVAHVIAEVLDKGANNVHVVPAITKKGRPEYLFYVDTHADQVEAIGRYFARELGTIGMRVMESRHLPFTYRFRQVRVTAAAPTPTSAPIRVKQVLDADQAVLSVKADYEDLKRELDQFRKADPCLALSFNAFKAMVEQAVRTETAQTLDGLTARISGDTDA